MSKRVVTPDVGGYFEYHHDSVFSDESLPATPDEYNVTEAGSYFPPQPGAISIPPHVLLLARRTKDNTIWNILPSYHMFESIVGKSFELSSEDLSLPPPGYSYNSSRNLSWPTPAPSTPPLEALSASLPGTTPQLVSGSVWETSVVGNVDSLPLVNNKHIEIKIQTIKEVNRPGSKPVMESVTEKEYTSGDVLTGYVTIRNTSAVPIPFEMFLVCLEGNIVIVKKHKAHEKVVDLKPITHKLLNMIDLGASWNYEEIKQISDIDFIQGERDPYDNTLYGLPLDRKLKPGECYKKFFIFTLPSKLLDTVCPHDKLSHCLVSPSLGINKHEFFQHIRNHRTDNKNAFAKVEGDFLKDFCISNCSISYSIEARCVGSVVQPKAKTTFNILQNANFFFKYVPSTSGINSFFKSYKDIERVAYIESQNVFKRLDDMLKQISPEGNMYPMQSSVSLPIVTSAGSRSPSSSESPQLKEEQLYNPDLIKMYENPFIEASYTLRKKLLASTKAMGEVTISTKREGNNVDYLKPHARLKPKRTPSGLSNPLPKQLADLFSRQLMLEFEFRPASSAIKPPEFKSIHTELEIYTVSAKCPIPIELTIELLNNLDEFQAMLKTYVETIKAAGGKRKLFNDLELKGDIRSLTSLYCKKNLLPLFLTSVGNIKTYSHWDPVVGDNNVAHKTALPLNTFTGLRNGALSVKTQMQNMKVLSPPPTSENPVHKSNIIYKTLLDLNVCLKEYEPKLVPSFQACLLGRLYAIRVVVKFAYGDPVCISLPLTINNS
ncbi:hypothetical protein BABINDRAFT_10270 [Babjeviella inositovora NRRL Y-12698]|uniref:Bul1 N-terminal domain-containing protein n=1 Tax=Babjeviella inositovora NRRL Y-12698 TaxID=984486 RepID=A0A1E3QI47_9ASCO|nr:uncharacterized protein BABINDRAFT_10270 [Babjeviella inositovora NRRL Y-12698]ODQ77375.1 hypothetical protein BABINDRAFT_10270 [Babjeviella inositovora NRRL Y-12698]